MHVPTTVDNALMPAVGELISLNKHLIVLDVDHAKYRSLGTIYACSC